MCYFKAFLCFGCIILADLAHAESVLPSNKTNFSSLFNSKAGYYELETGDIRFCVSGTLQWLDNSQTDLGFRLGDLITFNSLHNGTQTNKVSNFCLITTKFKYTSEGIKMTLRHDRCDNQSDELDLTQTIRFLPNGILKYTLSDPSVECTFKKATQ